MSRFGVSPSGVCRWNTTDGNFDLWVGVVPPCRGAPALAKASRANHRTALELRPSQNYLSTPVSTAGRYSGSHCPPPARKVASEQNNCTWRAESPISDKNQLEHQMQLTHTTNFLRLFSLHLVATPITLNFTGRNFNLCSTFRRDSGAKRYLTLPQLTFSGLNVVKK